MKYVCCRCMNYETTIKSRYVRHLKRKFPCQAVNSITTSVLLSEVQRGAYIDRRSCTLGSSKYIIQRPSSHSHECKYCGKTYSTNSHMHRHMRSCKHRTSPSSVDTNTAIVDHSATCNNLTPSTIPLAESKLQEIIQKTIDDSLGVWIHKVGNVTNQYHSQHINNPKFIINTHGCENIQHITQKYLKMLMGIPFGAVPRLLKEIHFNPQFPQNRNVQITNKKQKWAKVWEGEEWKLRYKKEVIRSMVDKGFHMIDEKFHEVHDRLEEHKKEQYMHFQQKFSADDKELHRTLETDIELIILNNSTPST